jgi:hypothetical protein
MSDKPKFAMFSPYGNNIAPSKKKSGLGLGDRIERIVKPIAVALKAPCLDEEKRLKTESPCAKRRDVLNKLGYKVGIGIDPNAQNPS